MAKSERTWRYTQESDLTPDQIEVTQNSYRRNAVTYANYERSEEINGNVIFLCLIPFLERVDENNVSGKILFAGCGSCRDLQYAENQGYNTIGIDTSQELLEIARENGVKSTLVGIDIFEYPFQDDDFAGIYCDTALTHTTHEGLRSALGRYNKSLKKDGVLFIEFREGDGRTYETQDEYGQRFYITHTREQAESLITSSGFKINKVITAPHPINGRPGFIAIIATKI